MREETTAMQHERVVTEAAESISTLVFISCAMVTAMLAYVLGSLIALGVCVLALVAIPINRAILRKAHRLIDEDEHYLYRQDRLSH